MGVQKRTPRPMITMYITDQLGPYREELLNMMGGKTFPGGYSASAWLQEVIVLFFQLAEIYQERDPRRLLLKILQAVKDKEKSEAEKPAQEEPDIRRKVLSRALRFGSET